MTPDELTLQINELKNQITELRGMISNSQYSNTILQNKNVVQASGEMRSPNYVPGTSGWAMDSDGNLEAQDGTFRGAISASSITGGTIDGTTITGGILQTSASGHRVKITGADDTITFYNSDDDKTIILDGSGDSGSFAQVRVGLGGVFVTANEADFAYGGELYAGGAGGGINTVIHSIDDTSEGYFFFGSDGKLSLDEISVGNGASGSVTNTTDGYTLTFQNGIITNIS